MYSGTTLRHGSGNVVGAHQKIDKVARRHLTALVAGKLTFPAARQILHFEGKNGPDGIKRKSPARDEPWHYIDPANTSDQTLVQMIEDHKSNLISALADDNFERAAFEAAWMAHAIVDGLTPAHHFPLEAKLEELREGQGLETRTSVKEKLVMPGNTRRKKIRNNWEFWGAKGIMTTHVLFEIGIATAIAPLKLDTARPNGNERIRVENEGIVPFFMEVLAQVHGMKLYEEFHRQGWTRRLARQTRHELAPLIVKTVTLAWYDASIHAMRRRERRDR
jgi:hypothetical protein